MHHRRFPISTVVSFLSFCLLIVSTGCSGGNSYHSDPLPGKTLTSISVSPATASIVAGATQQFTAMATYSDGSTADVTSTATWISASVGAATINSAGMATAVAVGSTTVTASLSGVSGTAMLTVTAATKTVTAISVSPATPSIAVGATQQFTATATYSDNSTANVTSTATWTSANKAAATISSTGLATAVAVGSSTVTASQGGISGTAMLTVTAATTKTVTSIAVTPATPSIALGATQQFTATATYSDNSTANVTSTVNWTVANQDVATIDSAGLATPIASGSTSITASLSGVSGTVPFVVTIAPGTGVNVVTWHFDANRSGLNSGEQSLTPANVSSQTFGKLFSYLVDGYVYGEPLLVSNVAINGGRHNVLYVATEKDSVYAFDADTFGNGTPLWKVSLLQSGETPITESSTNMADGVIRPYKGITSTPVIDLTTNTMYVVSTQVKSGTAASFRLNAVDIATGAQKFGGPVTIHASVPGTNAGGTNGMVTLTASCLQRSALLLANNTVYMGFGGCVTGWLLAYDAQTLAQTAVFNASPNLNGEGTYASAGGIWMGGGGPVADSSGNIYVVTGNGPWDGQTAWGDSVLKFNAQLQMQDYFTPDAYQYMDCRDADMASGGLLLVPGTTEILAGGKTGRLFLLNTGNLGHEQANDVGATQRLWFESDLIAPYSYSCTDSSGINTAEISSYENFGTAAYFNGSIYLGVTPNGQGVIPAGVRQFTYSANSLTPGTYPGAYTAPSIQLHSYGTTPFISANGATNGIMWMIDHGSPLQNPAGSAPTTATLRAYDASDLAKELYNSSTNPSDVPGYGIKFTSPVVVNGKVYISTGHDPVTAANPQGEIDVYGLK